METRTLFSDQTEMFFYPVQPKKYDTVTILFRTGRLQAERVLLCVDGLKEEMQWAYEANNFDYYAVNVGLETHKVWYYFEIHAENECCWYGKKGVVFEEYGVSSFEIIPGFEVPDWLQGAVMYQIYVDRFYNGNKSNDTATIEYRYLNHVAKRIRNWDEKPEMFDVCNFHGGDLKGIIDKLDYLQDLGIEVIYLNPVFVSPTNHKYDVMDYHHIDPHIGRIVDREHSALSEKNLEASDKVFIRLVNEAHKRNMRVIIDGVFNHCSHMGRWMDYDGLYKRSSLVRSGAFGNPKSRYKNYFHFKDRDCLEYECWWDNINLPKLNYEKSRQLYEEIMEIAAKWVSPPFNVDGWRLDVAADLGHSREFNHKFWREFRHRVKTANPEAVIIAEHYENAWPWLQGDQWDTVMNYTAFMEPVSWFLTGMEKHSDQFRPDMIGNTGAFEWAMNERGAEFMQSSLFAAMNQLDNHDHSRFLTRTNHYVGRLSQYNSEMAELGVDKGVLRQAVVMQMTWPGAPTLYYGNEAGLCGFTDPDNRRAFPWGNQDSHLRDFYRHCIALRKQWPMLRKSSCRIIYGEYGILAYVRFTEKEQIYVVVSTLDRPVVKEIPVWIGGRAGYLKKDYLDRVLLTTRAQVSYEKKTFRVRHGILHMEIPPHSASVFAGK